MASGGRSQKVTLVELQGDDGLWRSSLLDPAGKVGWVQTVARAPAAVRAEDSAEFGAGALLLAAEQMLPLTPD